MTTSDENKKTPDIAFVPGEKESEQHLDFNGDAEDKTETSDPVNQPEQHITKEEFEQRESGQASSSKIPPPDDAPRSL